MAKLVNVVGGGEFGTRLPIEEVYSKIKAETKRYEPEQFPGLVLAYSSDSPTVTLFSSGNYHIAGANSVDEMKSAYREFSDQLESHGYITETTGASPEIRNRVYVEDIDRELKLEAFLPELGFEQTEYSPEQFPGLFHRPEAGGTIILFRSGKFVLTGISDKSTSLDIIDDFKQKIIHLIENSSLS